MSTDDRPGIGGTEISMIVGCNPYGTARTVFDRLVHGVELEPNKYMARGLKMEPVVRGIYADAVGAVFVQPKQKRLTHPKHHWAIASIDELATVMGDDVVAEFKTASKWQKGKWGPELSDGVPEHYLCQCHWYLGISGRQRAHLFAAFGADVGDNFEIEETRLFLIQRDEELERALFEAGERFWKMHIETGIPPEDTRRAA